MLCDEAGHLYVAPLDSDPLALGSDYLLPEEALLGASTLRCELGLWIPTPLFCRGARVGLLHNPWLEEAAEVAALSAPDPGEALVFPQYHDEEYARRAEHVVACRDGLRQWHALEDAPEATEEGVVSRLVSMLGRLGWIPALDGEPAAEDDDLPDWLRGAPAPAPARDDLGPQDEPSTVLLRSLAVGTSRAQLEVVLAPDEVIISAVIQGPEGEPVPGAEVTLRCTTEQGEETVHARVSDKLGVVARIAAPLQGDARYSLEVKVSGERAIEAF